MQTLTGGRGDTVTVGGANRHVIGYMKDFLFAPEQANTPVGVLSGGERARLTLARAFAKPSNLLVLDEPTNDLDLETLDLLQELLADYPGTVLLVSHDRDFIDRVVTSVIATEGDGRWIEYAGGYSDMLAQRGSATAAPMQAATKPRVATENRPQRALRFATHDIQGSARVGNVAGPDRGAAGGRRAAERGAGRSGSVYPRSGAVRRDDEGAGGGADRVGGGGGTVADTGDAARGT